MSDNESFDLLVNFYFQFVLIRYQFMGQCLMLVFKAKG